MRSDLVWRFLSSSTDQRHKGAACWYTSTFPNVSISYRHMIYNIKSAAPERRDASPSQKNGRNQISDPWNAYRSKKKNRKLTKSSKSSVKTGQLHWSLEIPSPPDTLAAVLSCLDQAWHSCSTALGPAATAASLNGGLRDEWDEWDDYSGDRIRLGWKLCYQCAM
jgi:hypothetical protein